MTKTHNPVAVRKPLLSRLLPYFMVAPTVSLILLFTIIPAINSLVDSTVKPAVRRGQEPQFVGLNNFQDLFDESHHIGNPFRRVFRNTFVYAFSLVVFSIPLATTFALMLNRPLRGLGLWRFSFFYPALLPSIAAGSIWAFLYAPNSGVFNMVLRFFGLERVSWLGNPDFVLGSVIVVAIWSASSFYMIFYLAGLQGIPKDLFDAAAIDGANQWQRFRYITFPLLKRTHQFVLTIGLIGAFQGGELLQALGEGGPNNASNIVLYFIVKRLPERANWGYINAMTVILLLIVVSFSLVNFVFFERGDNDES